MERELFLERVRSARSTSELPPAPEDPPGPLLPDLPEDHLVDRFLQRLEAVDGIGHRAAGDDDVVRIIAGLLETYGAREVLTWDPEHLPVPGLIDRLLVDAVDPIIENETRLEHQARYMDLRVGITGTSGGLAESGSIVLEAGRGRSRMASLIPLAHIALLREQDIVPGLSHWIAGHADAARRNSNLVFVTGPSRTADIEQTLNLGVHGPKDLHVIVLGSEF